MQNVLSLEPTENGVHLVVAEALEVLVLDAKGDPLLGGIANEGHEVWVQAVAFPENVEGDAALDEHFGGDDVPFEDEVADIGLKMVKRVGAPEGQVLAVLQHDLLIPDPLVQILLHLVELGDLYFGIDTVAKGDFAALFDDVGPCQGGLGSKHPKKAIALQRSDFDGVHIEEWRLLGVMGAHNIIAVCPTGLIYSGQGLKGPIIPRPL